MSGTQTQSARQKQNWTTTYDAQSFGNGETIVDAPAIAPIAIPAGATVLVDVSVVSGDGWSGVAFESAITWAASSAAMFSQDSTSSLWVTATYLT